MKHLTLVLKALESMDTKELKACYRSSFKIKALESVRPLIAKRLMLKGLEPVIGDCIVFQSLNNTKQSEG
jgi:hypothetical protein